MPWICAQGLENGTHTRTVELSEPFFFFCRTMDVAHNFPHVAFRGLDIGCHLFSTFSELRLMRLKSPLPQDTRFPT
jgi:hypothetical protein